MIEKLNFLLALSREHHFGRAADACHVTQQTFSAGVKNLEDRLGVRLVQRGSRYQGFTPEGERVLTWARRIVADSRAMREDIATLRRAPAGHLRIAAIPTALPTVVSLTTAYRERYPDVRFSVKSTTSADILASLENLETDVGLTYLDTGVGDRVVTVPLYQERYQLLTADSCHRARASITWAEVGLIPLCLLTPDMENRRIIDQQLQAVGGELTPVLETNSMIVLLTHVFKLKWSSVIPAALVEALGSMKGVHAIPIMEPDISQTVGVVASHREPTTPMIAAFFAIARSINNNNSKRTALYPL